PLNASTREAWFLHELLDQAQDDQQDHRADEGVDDAGDDADAKVDAEHRQQISGNDGADIADEAEAAAFDDHAGKPAGNRANDQPNNDALRSHVSPSSLAGKGLPCA